MKTNSEMNCEHTAFDIEVRKCGVGHSVCLECGTVFGVVREECELE